MELFGLTKTKFKVTDKSNEIKKKKYNFKLIPFIILLILSIVGIVRIFIITNLLNITYMLVLIYWLVFNLYSIIMVLLLVYGRAKDEDYEAINVRTNESVKIEKMDGVINNGVTYTLTEHSVKMVFDDKSFIKLGDSIDIIIETDIYKVTLTCVVIEVHRIPKTKQYMINTEIINYNNIFEYYQILFDREPTLPNRLKRDTYFELLWRNIVYRVLRVITNSFAEKPKIKSTIKYFQKNINISENFKFLLKIMVDTDMKDTGDMTDLIEPEEKEKLSSYTNKKLTVNDFSTIRVIGKGSYGKVLLVKKNDDEQIYAMKVLKKKAMIKRNQVTHIKAERRIMELIDHPFIVKLRYAFQSPQKLYMVMDYCPGGELFFHIQRVERFNEEAVKFYAAQLALAIDHLHKNNIIYRDLKPENVLINKDGYIKITDFGLSKENISDNTGAKSFCGTPEYLAPEIVEGKGHGQAVDWWSLGSILYEMLTGMPPFYNNDREKLFNSIKSGQVKFPKYLSKEAVDLLQKFFVKDPEKRLGSGPNGLNDIKSHPFFSSIDWDSILAKKIKPPFTPKLKSPTDTRYIDQEFTNLSIKESIGTGDSLNPEDDPYGGFSYDPNKANENQNSNI